MNKENKIISLKLAKRIAKIAKEKGIKLPESEYSWVIDNQKLPYLDNTNVARITIKIDDVDKKKKVKYISAYDTSELGEMLLRMIKVKDKIYKIIFYKNEIEWVVAYKEWKGKSYLKNFILKPEAENRGKMLYFLLENELIK